MTDELARKIGPTHNWRDAWEGSYLSISGEIVYDQNGEIKRVKANRHAEIEWYDVPLSMLEGVDLLQGRTIRQHLDEFWGEAVG